jgi:cytochrome c554/c'-like protein
MRAMRRRSWPVWPVMMCATFIVGCSRPELQCEVDLSQADAGVADVTCRAGGVPEGAISIKQMVPDDQVRVSRFAASTPGRGALRVDERRDAGVGAASHRFTERVVLGAGDSELIYTYRVEPGAWMDESLHNSQGRRFGRLDGRGGLLSGRNLFLLPSWYESLAAIEVKFHSPGGWEVVGTLPRVGSGFRTTGVGQAAIEVVDSVVGVGKFETSWTQRGKSTLRLYASTDLPDGLRREAFRVATEGFAYLDDRLGPLGHEYAMILVAPSADGSMILVPATTAGQGSEIASVGPAQVADLLYSMARAYTDFLQAPFTLARDDWWLKQALPAYYTVRVEDALGLRSSRQAWRLRAKSGRAAYRSLADPPPADDQQKVAALAKGTWVLARAEADVTIGGEGPDGVDGFVRRLRQAGGTRGFFDLMAGSPLEAERPELEEVAKSTLAIPKEWIAAVNQIPPLELNTSSPSERSAKGLRRLRILMTYDTNGMLEVCGCKARQLGGIARRETIRRQVLGRGPAVLVDLGNAYALSSNDPLLDPAERDEMDLALGLMRRQGYSVCAIGHSEMLRGPRFFQETSGRLPLPYISANLETDGRPLTRPWKVIRSNGIRIGWISALDPRDYGSDHSRYYEERLGDLVVHDPLTTLSAAAREVRRRADLVVAIGSLSPDLVRRLLEAVPEIDAILSTEAPDAVFDGTLAFPTSDEKQVRGFHGRTLVFFGSGEGKYLDQLDLALGPDGAIADATFSDYTLDEAVPDDRSFRSALSSFYEAMKDRPDLAGSAEPVARVLPARLKGAAYVGAEVCAKCHAEEWTDWHEKEHGVAFSTLLLRHRNYAPGCVRCHVTGYGIPSGYRLGDPLERLRHVQCEMCHGPGSTHASAPSPLNIVRRPPREACSECHTPQHSDMTAENFPEYYRRTLHGGASGGTTGR